MELLTCTFYRLCRDMWKKKLSKFFFSNFLVPRFFLKMHNHPNHSNNHRHPNHHQIYFICRRRDLRCFVQVDKEKNIIAVKDKRLIHRRHSQRKKILYKVPLIFYWVVNEMKRTFQVDDVIFLMPCKWEKWRVWKYAVLLWTVECVMFWCIFRFKKFWLDTYFSGELCFKSDHVCLFIFLISNHGPIWWWNSLMIIVSILFSPKFQIRVFYFLNRQTKSGWVCAVLWNASELYIFSGNEMIIKNRK